MVRGLPTLMGDACGYESSGGILVSPEKRQVKMGTFLCSVLGSGSASM